MQQELKAVKAAFAEETKKKSDSMDTVCVLMHKRTPVAELWLDGTTGFVQKIGTVYAPEHLPVGIMVKNSVVDRKSFNAWWTER